MAMRGRINIQPLPDAVRRHLAGPPEEESPRSRSPPGEEEPPDADYEVLDFMPRPGSEGLDLDFTYWPMPPADLGEFGKDFVLSNWFWMSSP